MKMKETRGEGGSERRQNHNEWVMGNERWREKTGDEREKRMERDKGMKDKDERNERRWSGWEGIKIKWVGNERWKLKTENWKISMG